MRSNDMMRRVAGAALSVAVTASLGVVGVGTAFAAGTGPSWASNTLFASGLSAFTNDAKGDPGRWCHPGQGTDPMCNLRDPKDLGAIGLNGAYVGTYETNGYLSAYDLEVRQNPNYGLTVQTYEDTLKPGRTGYLYLQWPSCGSQYVLAAHGDSTYAGGSSEDYVYTGDSGVSSTRFARSAKENANFAGWLLARDNSYPAGVKDVYKNGDRLLLQHVSYPDGGVGGNAGRGCTSTPYQWTALSNQGGKDSKVSFSLAAPEDAKGVSVEYFVSAGKPNRDVTAATPHQIDVIWLQAKGITTGYRDGTFRGGAPVARQDMAAFLYRLAGSPAFDASKAANPFRDVKPSTPHYKEILWLASTGISTGWAARGGREFRGGAPVARQDMAAFLHRLAVRQGANPQSGSSVAFTDVNAGTPHAADIAWLAKAGVTTGWAVNLKPDYEFRGMNTVVRQDMAAFLHRLKTNVLK